jgi:hypothetical protein
VSITDEHEGPPTEGTVRVPDLSQNLLQKVLH